MPLRINIVQFTGRATQDPKLNYTGTGLAVLSVDMAVNFSQKENGEWKSRAMFFRVKQFGKSGESMAEKIRKGAPLYVQGRLTTEEWETKDGIKRSTYVITADRLEVDEASGSRQPDNGVDHVGAMPFDKTSDDDGIPF